jgi:hypothetical protein
MESEDTLKKLLVDTAKKEKRAYRRATVYTAIPLLVGIIWLSYSINKVGGLELQQKQLMAESLELDKQIKIKKDSLVTAELDLAQSRIEFKKILDEVDLSKKAKRDIDAALTGLARAESDVQVAISAEARPKAHITQDPSSTPITYSTIPDVIGLKTADAEQKTRQAGLTVRKVDQPARGTRGTVIYQDPLPGKQVPAGAELSIYVIIWIEVPSLKGLTFMDAEKRLRQARLTVKNEPVPGVGTPGTVLYQDPVQGTYVPPGTEVTINVIPAAPKK